MKYTILFLLLLIGTTVFGQMVKGYIYDAKTDEPLPGVHITYESKQGKKGTASDEKGYYELSIPAGGVHLTFNYLGYKPELVPLVLKPRETVDKNIYLHTEEKLLDAAVVTAGRFEQKMSDLTVSMDVLKSDQVLKQDPGDITATLKTVPGVDVVDRQPSIRGGNGWVYGVGSRTMILVDGQSALDPGSGQINWNTIPMEDIAQIEVLKGASSVLYGSSALNGVINIRTNRPGLAPRTNISAYLGIYGTPPRSGYEWRDQGFYEYHDAPVEPFLRKNVLAGIRQPLYTGVDFSHSRRIGNFDVSGGINLFADEGYREAGYNRRVRVGGNVTYHQPGKNIVNYGANINFLSYKNGDFFVWRSPYQAYRSSQFTNMGREGNQFKLSPFFNFTDPDRNFSHKVNTRFFYSGESITKPLPVPTLPDILGNMGADASVLGEIVGQATDGDYLGILWPILKPAIPPLLQGDLSGALNGILNGGLNTLNTIFPNATTADYSDLITWGMNAMRDPQTGSMTNIPNSSNLIPWLNNALNPQKPQSPINNTYNAYVDYKFNKSWGNRQLTAGMTYEHLYSESSASGSHSSDNAALYVQYDDKFFDRLNISVGVRGEYYRVDNHKREAKVDLFGTSVPVRPVIRGGISYKLAEYSFVRASYGQGYRFPSLVEKYIRKDIGGVGAFPNPALKPESGYNVELGFKQGYKFGNLQGFVDLAGFYTEYKDMIEFRIGLFNGTQFITGINDIISMITNQNMPGIGAQFYNIRKARIYGAEISTTGSYAFNPNTHLIYNIGYTYTEPEDADYKEKNAAAAATSDPLYMHEKSNNSKYLKYRPKHSFKTTLDFNYKRISVGTNLSYKSKTLAVDYIFLDERIKEAPEIMDHVRSILLGTEKDGYNMAKYWAEHNKGYLLMDLRLGVKVTDNVNFQFLVNNLLNQEYSFRPMAVGAPRTFITKVGLTF